jgi:hypothetical protein
MVITMARNKTTPITVAAMAATENPWPASAGPEVGVGELVEEGADVVEEGEFWVMQVESLLISTLRTSDVPPWFPCASTMKKTMSVPESTFAVQSKEVGPAGGFRTKNWPSGIRP